MSDMEMESEFAEQPLTVLVYNRRDGRVVHVHQFVGDGTGTFGPDGQEERARLALQHAGQYSELEHLRAVHARPQFTYDPAIAYRLNLETEEILSTTAPGLSLRELFERRRRGTKQSS